MPDKPTDKEIKKALEWNASKFPTAGFVYMTADDTKLVNTKNVLDLINRLQAENEELKTTAKGIAEMLHIVTQDDVTFRFLLNDAVERERVKQEAYKEFADRLKSIMNEKYQKYDEQPYPIATISIINNLLKELVGVEK